MNMQSSTSSTFSARAKMTRTRSAAFVSETIEHTRITKTSSGTEPQWDSMGGTSARLFSSNAGSAVLNLTYDEIILPEDAYDATIYATFNKRLNDTPGLPASGLLVVTFFNTGAAPELENPLWASVSTQNTSRSVIPFVEGVTEFNVMVRFNPNTATYRNVTIFDPVLSVDYKIPSPWSYILGQAASVSSSTGSLKAIGKAIGTSSSVFTATATLTTFISGSGESSTTFSTTGSATGVRPPKRRAFIINNS